MLHYKVFGLLYTRTCPLQCRHCIIESSPSATGKMAIETAATYLPTIARHTPDLCFTGGEPMLYFQEIAKLTSQARDLGLNVSMVSGAGWVRVDKAQIVRDRMRAMKRAGLNMLCISWDQYHEEWSPKEQAELLATVAEDEGIPVVVRGVTAATFNDDPTKPIFGRFKPEYQTLVKLGSANNLPEDQFYKYPLPPRGGCEVVVQPVVEPSGMVYACCGPSRYSKAASPLVLGNTNEENLESIISRAKEDPILQAMYLMGPVGLYDLMQQHAGFKTAVPQRAEYTSVCNMCLDVTESLEGVAMLRNRFSTAEGRALLVAAEMYRKRKESSLPMPMVSASAVENVQVARTI